ncbi:MAG: hypothetical protein BGO98_49580 [Myxococcales bacterium 68-20]|nr:hypothetical protein [Myxococcales bacterium]OJY29868.1 MAG: hypothetical protein BGO98_49580 [Myxococcales bacterium 68-20]
MNDHRWETLDHDDESFVDGTLRAGREDLPDEARMRALEDRLGSALEKEPPPSGWWSRSRLYPVVGLAVVALGVRAGSSLLSTPSPSVVAATPATPLALSATELAPTPPVEPLPAESTSGVSVESLPSAEAPHAAKVTATPDAKARPSAATSGTVGTTDELALLEEASRALDASPERALTLTDEHMKRFRTPKFAQERERLAIVALVRLGRRDDAKRRADAFEAAFPRSAHLTRVRELVRP